MTEEYREYENGLTDIELQEEEHVIEEEHVVGRENGGFFRWLMEMLLTVGAAVLLALFLQAYVVKTYIVPTGSMVPTIQLDDRIISNRLAYRFGEPEVGDVVVVLNPSQEGPPLVKRVVAVGDQEFDFADGWVYLDGVRQEESWVQPERRGEDSIVGPITIPKDHVYLMGDNRVGSSDSRVFGSVSEDTLLGQAVFLYWPLTDFGFME